MKKHLVLVIVLLFAKQSQANEASNKIKYMVSDSWAEPYAFFDRNKTLIDGVMKEMGDALSRKLEKPFDYILVPTKRVKAAVTNEKLDLLCFMNEDWVKNPDDYDWSDVVFYKVDNLYSKNPIKNLQDLEKKTVGTVVGYIYSAEFEKMTSDSKIKREDSSSEPLNILKFAKSRLDYAIIESAAMTWYIRTEETQKFPQFYIKEIEKNGTKCAVPKKNQLSIKDVNAAISKLKEEGFFRRLVVKYGLR